MGKQQEYTGYTDKDYLETIADLGKAVKQRSYELMQLKPGQKVLDVGCGPGLDTVQLALKVGSGGEVTGIDYDPEMIEAAEHRAKQEGVASWVRHIEGNALTLPFRDNYFDACRSERLFIHLDHPELVLDEIIRVTRPGGWIVLVDTDADSGSTETTETDIDHRIKTFTNESLLANGYAGRKLYGLMKEKQLMSLVREVKASLIDSFSVYMQLSKRAELCQAAVKAGVVSQEEVDKLMADLIYKDERGQFHWTYTTVLVAGQKA